ncbi:MAG: hypothetical protein QOD94_3214 [Alphaproteobacteria bacterium]|jgi:hypothetical protein|nr:hypothetical protein [Alphaproteobacteria bacterium]
MEERPVKSAKVVTRSELYQLVWKEPMSRLAATFSMSDVGLAKICRKHDIPCPPRGYWAKKQHGQEPAQVPLPKSADATVIELHDPSDPAITSAVLRREAVRKMAEQQPDEAKIVVADTLRGAHELVSRTNQELQSARTSGHGLIIAPAQRSLDVTTSKGSFRRALLIMDALLKTLEQRGYTVEAGPAVTILGQVLRFSITEQLETKREPCNDDEVDLDGAYSFGHSRVKEQTVASGRFTLKINDGGTYWTSGVRHTWRDTEKHRLEHRLDSFVAGLVEMAARLKEHHEEQQRQAEVRRQQELRRQEEARQLAERRKLYKAEKAQLQTLLTQAENWRKSKLVRELIEAVRNSHAASGPIEPGSKIAEWIQWATRQAERLDPLCVSPPSILDEDLEEKEDPRPGYRQPW